MMVEEQKLLLATEKTTRFQKQELVLAVDILKSSFKVWNATSLPSQVPLSVWCFPSHHCFAGEKKTERKESSATVYNTDETMKWGLKTLETRWPNPPVSNWTQWALIEISSAKKHTLTTFFFVVCFVFFLSQGGTLKESVKKCEQIRINSQSSQKKISCVHVFAC